MEKTIKIGKKNVRLSNNVGWTMAYRDQFGRDVVPALLPMIASAMDIISGFLSETGKTDKIELEDILKVMDGDSLVDAMIHLGGLEFVDLLNVTWAMAKCSDEEIPEPREWVKQFEEFPVDVVAPEVVKLIVKGMVSSKNLKRLEDMMKALRPEKSQQTTLSSQESTEV